MPRTEPPQGESGLQLTILGRQAPSASRWQWMYGNLCGQIWFSLSHFDLSLSSYSCFPFSRQLSHSRSFSCLGDTGVSVGDTDVLVVTKSLWPICDGTVFHPGEVTEKKNLQLWANESAATGLPLLALAQPWCSFSAPKSFFFSPLSIQLPSPSSQPYYQHYHHNHHHHYNHLHCSYHHHHHNHHYHQQWRTSPPPPPPGVSSYSALDSVLHSL